MIEAYQYGVFILAYDLLQEWLKGHMYSCNEAYEVCSDIYEGFIASQQFFDLSMSEYDVLKQYLTINGYIKE